MARRRRWFTVLIGISLAARCLSAQTLETRLVDVGGHRLNVATGGSARLGTPTVVFEAGLGSTLGMWFGINRTIAESARTVAYERAGIGASEPSPKTPSISNIVAELHTLLAAVGAPPPYVLVGHSLGGPMIRAFATTFPNEVTGLVYIDPTDFMQTNADMNAEWEGVGAINGRDSTQKVMKQMFRGAPPAVVAELNEFLRMENGGFEELRSAGEAPDVPLVVLLAGRNEPVPAGLGLPGDQTRLWRNALAQRIDHFTRLTALASHGALWLTTGSSHYVHATEPDLVVQAIRRVLVLATPHPELERFVGKYLLAPTLTISISQEAGKLFVQLTGQSRLPIVADAPMKFSNTDIGFAIEFESEAAGNVTALVLSQNGARHRAPRVK